MTMRRARYSATAGLPFDDEELESKLVWIYGSPRTGSTWLLEMLCDPLRPNQGQPLGFAWPKAWSGPATALPVDEFLMSSHLAPTSGGTVELLGTMRFGTLNGFLGKRPSYAFSKEFAEFWRPEARRMTLVRLHGVVQRAQEAGLDLQPRLPLLVIKEVNGSHAADLVMSLFPRSKMIFLVRDGRDVIDSLAAANSPEGFLRVKRETNLEWVRDQCERWAARVDVCTRAFEKHDAELRWQIRYEDLLADTVGTLGPLLEWLGLPAGEDRVRDVVRRRSFDAVPDDRKGSGRHRRSATPGKWREGLSDEVQEIAREVMGDRLARLGYDE
jgi:Sulfotransferase family